MKKISVLIPDGDDDRSLIVVRNLAYSGQVNVHVLSPKNRNVFLSRHCITHELHVDYDMDSARFERVKEIDDRYSIDILLPIGEIGIRFVQQYRENLDDIFRLPPIPDAGVLETVSDKWFLNEFLRKNTYPFVRSILYKDQMNGETKDFSFPALLKPRIGAGGIGIRYVKSRKVLSNILGSTEYKGKKNSYMIQEFMEGASIDMSVFCLNGKILAYTIQRPMNTLVRSFTYSRVIEFLHDNRLFNMGEKVLSKLGWSGIAHLNFIYNKDKDQYYLIDFNPRYWGTLTGSVMAGVNFPFLACQLAIGESFAQPEYHETKYAIIKPKDIFRWLFKRKGFEDIPFSSTNLLTVLKDPLPALNIYNR